MIPLMRTILPTLLLTAGASIASAQQASNDSRPTPSAETAASAPTPQSQPAGPTMDRAAAGIRATRNTDAPAAVDPLPRREPTNQNKAMMIVGGAALIAGAIINDDVGTIIMVGGAGFGLWGLWKYLE